jgi:hypothetical protein
MNKSLMVKAEASPRMTPTTKPRTRLFEQLVRWWRSRADARSEQQRLDTPKPIGRFDTERERQRLLTATRNLSAAPAKTSAPIAPINWNTREGINWDAAPMGWAGRAAALHGTAGAWTVQAQPSETAEESQRREPQACFTEAERAGSWPTLDIEPAACLSSNDGATSSSD